MLADMRIPVIESGVHLPLTASDDRLFIDLAEKVINAEAALISAEFIHIVKIDSWFGDAWYTFAGKALGALGVHSSFRLRVPPFHPHRVVSEHRFRCDDPLVPVAFRAPLHFLRSSEGNLHHMFGGIRHQTAHRGSAIAAWYSGNSAAGSRGSIMVYSATPHGALAWYVGVERREEWDLVKLVGASRRHWETLLNGGPTV